MMEWQVVQIKQEGGRNTPFASIGRGQIEFNATACELINDDGEKYKYAQFLKAKKKTKRLSV